jgi:subtilisin family serine protease/predicted acylesterase/phospholipase RssA
VKEGIGVALSGGGHRASLFGLGALLYLADAGKSKQVRSIASVSGGSLTNGVVAQSLRYREASASTIEEALRPFATQLASEGTFLNAPFTSSYLWLLGTTLVVAAGTAWFIPVHRGFQLLIACGLIALWGILVLSHAFATRLGQVYGVVLASTLYASSVGPWLVPIAGILQFALFIGALGVWASTLLGMRGRVCAEAFRTTLFSPEGRVTNLADIPTEIDHVFCATDLQSAEQVYFSGSFIYGYRYGKGKTADLPLHAVVQASAALPGAFPPKWLSTADHRFEYQTSVCPPKEDRPPKLPARMVLVDGGVYDNMADQWAQGFENRARCWPGLIARHYEPEELIVVNASAGLELRLIRRAWIPILGELAALWKDKDVLYDQTTAIRRHGLVGRFDRAELQRSGMRGALVHIAQSPHDVASSFKDREDWPARAERARSVLIALGDTREAWAQTARDNAAVKTSLTRLGTEVAAQLLWHSYVLAMANLHVILGYPLLRVPSLRQFADYIDGAGGITTPTAEAEPVPTSAERVKIQPKLRMFADGDDEVNTIRAEINSALRVAKRDRVGIDQVLGVEPKIVEHAELPESVKLAQRAEPAEPRKVKAHVFVGLVRDLPSSAEVFPGQTARRGNLAALTVSLADLDLVAARPEVASIELGEALFIPQHLDDPAGDVAPPEPAPAVALPERHRSGKGVLVGIIDAQGFDFSHEDFADGAGGTRFVRIWDQGGSTRPPPSANGNGGFDYGAEFRKEHLDRAIAQSTTEHLPAYELEPQSVMAEGSHGTHVASIAAGNHSPAAKAFLAGVLVSIPHAEADRRGTFSDSTRIAHAVDYLLRVAEELRIEHGLDRVPVSINISLGTNGHAHDGTSAASRWIDSALSVPGRSVCVAAGNAGQHMPEFQGDTGWIMGRVHTFGTVRQGGEHELEWIVVGNSLVDTSENELELWYSPQDRFAVSVLPPSGEVIPVVEPQHYIQNLQLADGSFLSIYNELYHPANGLNYIAAYLSPAFSESGVGGVAAGTWRVSLHGREVRDGRFHGWIERDDPRPRGRVGAKEFWLFPSLFSTTSLVDDSTVSSLACGRSVVSVANLDAEKVNASSGQGPTRDGRFKPDVAAPGTNVVAAKGFPSDPADPWTRKTGTSMASPYVAGIASLMLAAEPRLTAEQIEGIIQRTALPVSGTRAWANDAGFGRIDASACVTEAAGVNVRTDLFP